MLKFSFVRMFSVLNGDSPTISGMFYLYTRAKFDIGTLRVFGQYVPNTS